MSKTAVIYYSKYGTTENYARLIAKALGADLFEAKKTKFRDIKDYDTVVFGGGIYSGGIRGIELITKNWYKGLCEKKVVCFAVGITIDKEENREQCMDINFRKRFVTDAEEDHGRDDLSASELIKEKRLPIKCFFLPGAFDPGKVKGLDKFIIGITKKMIDDSPEGQQLLDYFNKSCDLVDYDSIKPVVEACL
ncbi:flavodoxin domain protein [Eubacterium nodatum ATCC 33099]|nr:flavodoxin domain protein [Eubacterium nodatum ATCC 33099]